MALKVASTQTAKETAYVQQKKETKPATVNSIMATKQADKTKTAEFRDKKDGESWEHYYKERANFNYKNDIKTGKLEYVEAFKILGITISPQHYEYKAQKGETLGDVKTRYNLPDGSLRDQSTGGGGDFDLHKAPPKVLINEDVLEKGLGKKIFHEVD